MDKGGRPREPIWAEYECIKIDGKVLAKCKYCGHEFTGKVERKITSKSVNIKLKLW